MVPPIEFTEFIWIIIVITIRQIKDHWRGRFYLTNWVTTSKAEPFNNLGGGRGKGRERERKSDSLKIEIEYPSRNSSPFRRRQSQWHISPGGIRWQLSLNWESVSNQWWGTSLDWFSASKTIAMTGSFSQQWMLLDLNKADVLFETDHINHLWKCNGGLEAVCWLWHVILLHCNVVISTLKYSGLWKEFKMNQDWLFSGNFHAGRLS